MHLSPTKPLRHVIITGGAGFIGSQISARLFLDIVESTVLLERECFVRSLT